MERETKELKTTNGNTLVVYTYATGGECNSINSTYLDGAKITVMNGITNVDGINPNAEEKVKDLKVSLLVLSINGDKTDVLNKVKNLISEDYDELIDYLNIITSKKKSKAKDLK